MFVCVCVCVVVFLFNTVIYVFLLLCLCILIVWLCIFIVPAGTLRLPWLRFFRAFSSVVRQMPGYKPQRRCTVRILPKFLCCSIYCLFYVILCIVCVYMCTVLLPPGGYPIAVNIYISYAVMKENSHTFRFKKNKLRTSLKHSLKSVEKQKPVSCGSKVQKYKERTCLCWKFLLYQWEAVICTRVAGGLPGRESRL